MIRPFCFVSKQERGEADSAVIASASETIQRRQNKDWIASSLTLLVMTRCYAAAFFGGKRL